MGTTEHALFQPYGTWYTAFLKIKEATPAKSYNN